MEEQKKMQDFNSKLHLSFLQQSVLPFITVETVSE